MKITFKMLRWKNFLSYGDQFTELNLTKSPSTLITGENGAGKSTILEALVFGLYGKPYRKIKKAELLNSKNNRQTLVEIEFTTEDGGKKTQYLIRRGIKPDVFEIYENGDLLNQPGNSRDYQTIIDRRILRCTYEVFTQLVVVGKSVHTPFMTMKPVDRRLFVETVLNLDVFTVMNKVLTSKLSANREQVANCKLRHALAARDVEHKTRDIEVAKTTTADIYQHEIERLEAEIKEVRRQGRDLVKQKTEAESRLDYDSINKSFEIENKIQKAKLMIGQANARLADNKKMIQAIEHAINCDACGQKLPETRRANRLEQLTKSKSELEEAKTGISKKIEIMNEKLEAIKPAIETHKEAIKEIQRLETLISDRLAMIKVIIGKKGQIKEPKTASVDILCADLERLVRDEQEAKVELDMVTEETKYLTAMKNMLGDSGVKSVLVKKFVPMINQAINHHLSKLGFFGKFTLDQNFDETIKARGFEELGYHSYSEGEKLRIDLAVLMAWREMARLQGILHTNLLVFDEVVDASMDSAGTAALSQVLGSLDNVNVFIVSHSPEKIGDAARSQIEVVKDRRGFSKFKRAQK